VQNNVNALTCALAGLKGAQIAFEKFKPFPLFRRNEVFDLKKIFFVAGGEVVQTDNRLVKAQQCLQQVRADEAGDTCHQPAARLLAERLAGLFVGCHLDCSLSDCGMSGSRSGFPDFSGGGWDACHGVASVNDATRPLAELPVVDGFVGGGDDHCVE